MFELESGGRESSARRTLGGVLRIAPRVALGALFMLIGYTKLNDNPQGEWVRIFEQIGLGQWFRYFTGIVQITGGLLLPFSRTLTAGAAMLAATMLGAAIVDVFVIGSSLVIVPLLLLFVIATVWVAAT